jgi:hypothetical protein
LVEKHYPAFPHVSSLAMTQSRNVLGKYSVQRCNNGYFIGQEARKNARNGKANELDMRSFKRNLEKVPIHIRKLIA